MLEETLLFKSHERRIKKTPTSIISLDGGNSDIYNFQSDPWGFMIQFDWLNFSTKLFQPPPRHVWVFWRRFFWSELMSLSKRWDRNGKRNSARSDHFRPCLNVETWSSRKETTEACNDPHNTHNVRSQCPTKNRCRKCFRDSLFDEDHFIEVVMGEKWIE